MAQHEMKIKTWFIDKEQDKASRYNMWFTYSRRTDNFEHKPLVEDDCYYLAIEEVIQESEKAIQVRIATGDVLGSYKGWTLWIPKSVIVE